MATCSSGARVEALVAAAEQRDAVAGGELARVGVVEAPPARIERHDAALGPHALEIAAVGALDGARDRVDAQQHPRAAAERRVVDLRVRERRVVAVGEEAQRQRAVQRALHRGLLGEPREPVREEREDVDLEHRPALLVERLGEVLRELQRARRDIDARARPRG